MIELNMWRLIDTSLKKDWTTVEYAFHTFPQQQVADVLTKGLFKHNFEFSVSKLGLIDIYILPFFYHKL